MISYNDLSPTFCGEDVVMAQVTQAEAFRNVGVKYGLIEL